MTTTQDALEALNKIQDFAINGCSARDEDTQDTLRLIEEVRQALTILDAVEKQTVPCHAVGNEYCWVHDRAGKECHATPAQQSEAELIERMHRE